MLSPLVFLCKMLGKMLFKGQHERNVFKLLINYIVFIARKNKRRAF
jgi:hypothetical protein